MPEVQKQAAEFRASLRQGDAGHDNLIERGGSSMRNTRDGEPNKETERARLIEHKKESTSIK